MSKPNHPRRLIILKAAERLLSHYGPSKTTVADIAREAGVGVGTVYLEFSSKDDILTELATNRHAHILNLIRRVAQQDSVDHANRLRAVLDARVQAFLAQQEGGIHAVDLLHCLCPAIKQAWNDFQDTEHTIIAELIQE
ncbi:MAG: helix-turn-helix domain-containing protein, partial [Myxococcota bacterium]